jgi:hypothetical protein
MLRLVLRFLRALFQFSKRAAGEATKFGRSGVELLGVVGAARLECGEPAAESGGLIRRSLATTSAISSTFMGRSIAPAGLGLATDQTVPGCDYTPPTLQRTGEEQQPRNSATMDFLMKD